MAKKQTKVQAKTKKYGWLKYIWLLLITGILVVALLFVLYKLADLIFKDKFIDLAVVCFYAFSMVGLNTVLFIRVSIYKPVPPQTTGSLPRERISLMASSASLLYIATLYSQLQSTKPIR